MFSFKPQSTEKMSVAACLGDRKVLLRFWDNGFYYSKPTPDQEHSIATVLKVNRNERRLAESYRTKGSHV